MSDRPYWAEWHAIVTGVAVVLTLSFGIPVELGVPCWGDSGKLHAGWAGAGALALFGSLILCAGWSCARREIQ